MAELSGKLSTGTLGGTLSGGGKMSGALGVPKATLVKDYNQLLNKPQINGVTLEGNMNPSSLGLVSENTTEGWNSTPDYIPKRGEIVIYTDHIVRQDDLGNDIYYPGIKIGDGNAYLIDLPFTDDALRYDVLQALEAHMNNATIHVTQEDRDFWNSKLNYDLDGEELVLTRL